MTVWRTYYHLVWATRNRQPLITASIEPELYRLITAKAQSLNCLFHAIGGVEDHLHLVVSIPPSRSISDFVKRIKGSSSRYISQSFPHHAFAWQREYGVFSLGRKQLDEAIAIHSRDSSWVNLDDAFTGIVQGISRALTSF